MIDVQYFIFFAVQSLTLNLTNTLQQEILTPKCMQKNTYQADTSNFDKTSILQGVPAFLHLSQINPILVF
jgi:hypothetical protein